MRKLAIMLCAGISLLLFSSHAFAQLDENCIIAVLNRTAIVQPDGSWTLPNVPSNMGQVRARATCVRDGVTISGQSDFFTVVRNGITRVPPILFGDAFEQVPSELGISSTKSTLTFVGDTAQLTVIATYPDGSTADVTASSKGTTYTSTNPAIAAVNANGLVTAVASGRVLIAVSNEGLLSSLQLTVSFTGDSDGDGIPDDVEIANGLNPNNPIDALEDPDGDGLTSKQEYDLGTGMNNSDSDGDGIGDGEEVAAGADGFVTNPLLADSDGDGIRDGLEISTGSDPTNSGSFNLADALLSIDVAPSNFVIVYNTIMGEASRQLTVTGTLIDGNTIVLTSTGSGTNYNSSDLTVANFGLTGGLVFAGENGTATITATNNGFSDTAVVTVSTFSPTALSYVQFPGNSYANNVDVEGGYAFVAAGAGGLQVVDVSNPNSPSIVASIDTPGTAIDVKISDNKAFIADGESGLRIIDVSAPLLPISIGSIDTVGIAQDLVVDNNLVYIADGSNGLVIVNASDPANPFIEGHVDTPGTAKGVDVDMARRLAVVADGNSLRVIDISNISAPAIFGSVGISGDANDVVVRDGYAYVSAYTGGLQVVDFMTPTSPVVVGSSGGVIVCRDVALSDQFALFAEQLFLNAVPIFNISDPANPVFNSIINFSPLGDYAGTGIDLTPQYVYFTGESFVVSSDYGTTGNTRLFIGQYRMIQDTGTVAPTVNITSPLDGSEIIEGSTINITATATDDVFVASVSFIVNGEIVFTDTSAPYQHTFNVPLNIPVLTIRAEAIDLANNIGMSEDVMVNVISNTPPTVDITAPVCGSTVIEGATVSIAAEATDDINKVASVVFSLNGAAQAPDTVAPFGMEATVPIGVLLLNIEAVAIDNLGQESIPAFCVINVIPDPLTTVTGFVVDSEGNPVAGATVTTLGGLSAITAPDGSFSIPGVPTISGISVSATANIGGQVLSGVSQTVSPVPGGITAIPGNIVIGAHVNFESGDLTGFVTEGNVSVIQSIGSQVAPEGQYMAYLNTLPGSIGNRLSKLITAECLTAPAGLHTLTFEYNFLSWDYPPFNDSFEVIVRSSKGSLSTIVASVNANWREIMDNSTGYEWMTGFKTASIDISSLIGDETPCSLQFEFQVYDAIDTVVDSAVLIDNIRIQ